MSQGTNTPPPSPPDPLHDLIARVTADVKVAYEPGVMTAMVELERREPGNFVALYNSLKRCPDFLAGPFNRLLDAERSSTSSVIADPADAATILVRLSEAAKYFLGEGSEDVYADLEINGHVETVPVQSKQFTRWLRMRYFDDRGLAPGSEAVKSALATIEARAFKQNVFHKVHVRIGHREGKIYLDRNALERDVIEVDDEDWRILDRSPIKFIYSPDNGVLPIPRRGGRIEDLKRFINLYIAPEQPVGNSDDKSRVVDRDFKLTVASILGDFLVDAEFALTLFYGPHGSAKTTLLKRVCALVDPLQGDPTGPPREDREVMINARESFIQSVDNVKYISIERSGTPCRLLSGGRLRGRTLYTTMDTFNLNVARPVKMTATIVVITEEDLLDRTIIVRTGPAFDDDDDKRSVPRKPRSEIDREFASAWPQLLGCILTAVSHGLRNADKKPTESLPRLADLAVWTFRCEAGFGWAPGTILAAYKEAFNEAAHDLAEFDPVAAVTLLFMADHTEWEGPVTDLLHQLVKKAPQRITKVREWPLNSAVLGRRLRTLGSVLYHNGLALRWGYVGKGRSLALRWIDGPGHSNGKDPSPPDSEPQSSSGSEEDFAEVVRL